MKPNSTRPKKKPKLGVFLSRPAAAGAMGLPVELITAAINEGCLCAKRNGNIDGDVLTEWLDQHPEFVAKWNDEGAIPNRAVSLAVIAHFDGREKKRKYDEKIGKLIPRTEIANDIGLFARDLRLIIDSSDLSADAKNKIFASVRKLGEKWEIPAT